MPGSADARMCKLIRVQAVGAGVRLRSGRKATKLIPKCMKRHDWTKRPPTLALGCLVVNADVVTIPLRNVANIAVQLVLHAVLLYLK